MNVTIRTHHTSIDDDLRDFAEKKLSRLDRLLPRASDAVVEVTHEETRSAAHRFSVQVTVHSGPAILRAEERAADPRAAMEKAADVLSRQARRHGERLRDRHQKGGGTKEWAEPLPVGAVEPDADDEDAVAEYLLGKVVRIKRFEAKPMSEEEALAQMDLLGHDFFLFLDSGTSEYALLYKRKDGDYGMLAPRRG